MFGFFQHVLQFTHILYSEVLKHVKLSTFFKALKTEQNSGKRPLCIDNHLKWLYRGTAVRFSDPNCCMSL